jgi:type II secretory pathway component PulF
MTDLTILILEPLILSLLAGIVGTLFFLIYEFISEFLDGLS